MMKLLGNRKKIIKESSKADKAVQCDANDPYVRILILEKLPKFTDPSDEIFDDYLQRLQLIMNTLKIDEKDKVGFLLASLQEKAREMLMQSRLNIDANTTWIEVIIIMKTLYDPMQTSGNIQTLRQAKQQQNQDFRDFTHMVNQMVNNIFLQQLGYTDAQRECETIKYAIRGAKKELKDRLKGTKYNKIADLMSKAHDLESTMTLDGKKN